MKRPIHALLLTAATAALLACSDDDGGTRPDSISSSEGSSGTSSEEKASSGSAGEPGICGEGWTKVAPDDERIVYEGTWYPEVGPDSAVLKRHADVCMTSSACFTHSTIVRIGYHRMMAGVTMRLKARADTIYMKWNELWQVNESQRSLPFGVVRFGLMVDGKYRGLIGPESRDSTLSILEPHGEYMWLVSTSYDSTVHCIAIPVNSPDKTAEIEVIMPHKIGMAFHGLEIDGATALEVPEERDLPQFVAIGNSITHGEGQNTAEDGFAWKVARAKGWQLINLAIGTTTIQAGMAANNLNGDRKADVILVEWGYNDWSSSTYSLAAQTVEFGTLLDTIRALQPQAKVYVMTPLPTTTTSLSWASNIVPAVCFASTAANCVADSVAVADSTEVAAAPDSMVFGLSAGARWSKAVDSVVTDTTTIVDWRAMMRKEVKKRVNAGDKKLFVIEGDEIATFEDLSVDGVHLDSAGADAVAKRLIERLSL